MIKKFCLLFFISCAHCANFFTGLNIFPAITNDLDVECVQEQGFNASTLSHELRECIDDGFQATQLDLERSPEDTALRLSCEDKVTEKCWQIFADPINRCLPQEAQNVVDKMMQTYFAGYYSWCEDGGRDFKADWNRHEASCSELRSFYQEECESLLDKADFQHFKDLFTKDNCKVFMQYRLCHEVDSTQCPILREAYQSYLSHAYEASPCNQYSDI